MGLATEHELPMKKEESTPWTTRRLFPMKVAATVAADLVKKLTSPFQAAFWLLLVVICISELLGRTTSNLFWLLAFTLLAISVFERLWKSADADFNKEENDSSILKQ